LRGEVILIPNGTVAGDNVKAITATAVLVVSAKLVAVNITFCAVVIVAGAVYKPLTDNVPSAGVSIHDTPV